MQIVLTILFLLVGSCFGGWELRDNPADPNLIWWYFVPDAVKPIEKPTRQFIVCDNGILNDLERCGIYLFVWGKDNCVLVTRQNGAAQRITANKWQWQGSVRVMTYPEALAEIIDGWGKDERKYDRVDLNGLIANWMPSVDPNAIDIVERYITKASPELIIKVMTALARGDDLMNTMYIYVDVSGFYHRIPTCLTLPRGRYASGKIKEMTLLEAILQDRKPCSQCKPPTLGDK